MNKRTKIIAAATVILLIISAAAAGIYAHTFTDVREYDEAIDTLNTLGVIEGFNSYEYRPNQNITRWQMALLVTKLITGQIDASVWVTPPANANFTFKDIKNAAHYGGSIAYAASNGIIIGHNAETFAPEDGIILQDAVTMVIRAMGYSRAQYDYGYPNSYITKAAELGLFDELRNVGYTDTLTRAETAQVLYNALTAEKSNGSTIAADVFKFVDTTVVLAATDSLRIDTGLSFAGAGKVTMCALNSDGSIGGVLFSATAASLGISQPNGEIGRSYHIVAMNNYANIKTFEPGRVTDLSYEDSAIRIDSAASANIFINNVSYNIVNRYSRPLESATASNRELIIYGMGDIYNTVRTLSAGDMYGTTSYFKLRAFDDNSDGIIDRCIYMPYSLASYEKATTAITLKVAASNGTSTTNLALSETTVTGKTNVTAGSYIIYNYNAQTKVLDIQKELTTAIGTVATYNLTNRTIELYTNNSASSLKTFALGDAGLYGAWYDTVAKPMISASNQVQYFNAVVKYVLDGNNIIALVFDGSGDSSLGGTGFVSYTTVGIVTDINTSTVASGYMRLRVYNMNGADEYMYVSQINSQNVAMTFSSVARGDIVQYAQTGQTVEVSGNNQPLYNVVPFSGSPYATLSAPAAYSYYIGCNGYNVGMGYRTIASGNITYTADVKIDTTTQIYYSLDGTNVSKISTSNLLNGTTTTIGNEFAMYVSYGSQGTTTAKFVYFRPKVTSPTETDSSTFTTVVYLSNAAIASGTASDGAGGRIYLNADNVLTGEVIPRVYAKGDIYGTNTFPQRAGYYKVSLQNSDYIIVDTTPISTSINGANVDVIFRSQNTSGQLSGYRVLATGSHTYEIVVEGITYKTNSMIIYTFDDFDFNSLKKMEPSYVNSLTSINNSSFPVDAHVFMGRLSSANIADRITIILNPRV